MDETGIIHQQNRGYSDISYSEIPILNEYISAFDVDNDDIDFNVLNEISNRTKKQVMDSNGLNTIVDKANSMSSAFFENVDDKLDEYKNTYFQWVKNLKYVGTWSDNNVYDRNNIVDNNGNLYLSLKDINTSYIISNDWIKIADKGEQGEYGFNLNYRNEYSWQFNTYYNNDIVYVDNYDKLFYVCVTDNPSGISYNTEVMPWDDLNNWILLFSIKTSTFRVYDEMPSDDFLNHLNFPYVFGVILDDNLTTQFYYKDVNEPLQLATFYTVLQGE